MSSTATRTAQAIVFPDRGRVELQTLELPPLDKNDVLIRTHFSGASQGTERWVMHGRYVRFGDGADGVEYPCRPGYQAAGVVEEVGSGVTDLEPGDHVAVDGGRGADSRYNKAGGPAVGCHASAIVAGRAGVYRIDPEIDLAEASLYRVAAVGRHGVRLSEIGLDETVVVIGQGMIGQMSAQAARRRGARVIASDLLPTRLEKAAAYSADVVVDASKEDLGEVVRRETGRAGADVVIDTTGINTMFDEALRLIRREGRICMQGYYPDPIAVNFHDTHMMRPKVLFPCGWDAEDDGSLFADLAEGTLRIAPLITHRLTAVEAAERYKEIVDDPSASLGLIIDWTEGAA